MNEKHIYIVDLTDHEPDIYFTEMTEAEADLLREILKNSPYYHQDYSVEKIVDSHGFMTFKQMAKHVKDAG